MLKHPIMQSMRIGIIGTLLVVGLSFVIPVSYVHAACASLANDKGQAIGSLQVPSSGDYAIWLRILPASAQNTLFIQVDNQCPSVVDGGKSEQAFRWVSMAASPSPLIRLEAGQHTIKLAGRDAGVGVDRVIAATASCIPINTGSNCLVLPGNNSNQNSVPRFRSSIPAPPHGRGVNWWLLALGCLVAISAMSFATRLYLSKREHGGGHIIGVIGGAESQPSDLLSRLRQHAPLISAIAVSIAGIAIIIVSASTGPQLSFEVATGALSGEAKIINNPQAFNGKYVAFDGNSVINSNSGVKGNSGNIPAHIGSSTAGGGSSTPLPGGSNAGSGGITPTPPANGKNCASRPSGCGYPDETNTGWQHTGAVLTVVTQDPYIISTPGAVIAGLDIRGCIEVTATNVTIKNSKITCSNQPMVKNFQPDGNGGLNDVGAGLVMQDVEFDGMGDADSAGVAFDSYTIIRGNFHNIGTAIRLGNNVTVQDSYVHDIAATSTSHNGGFPSDGGTGIIVRHNTVLMNVQNGFPIALYNAESPGVVVKDVVVENNLLAGGNYIMYCGAPSKTSPNLTVTGNRFSRSIYSNGGYYGDAANCEGAAQWSNNYWDEDLSNVGN